MTAKTNPRPDADVRSVALYQFDGTDVWQEGDDRARLRGYFPLSPGTPNAGELSGEDLTMVCVEIEPGNHLPTHRDSAEELLLVIEGRVEASVDDATIDLRTGDCTIVPEGAPHGLRNVGEDPARIVGIFPRGELTATFEHPLVPFESATVHVGGEDGSE